MLTLQFLYLIKFILGIFLFSSRDYTLAIVTGEFATIKEEGAGPAYAP